MKGNTIAVFIDDLLSVGGPEKEFTFRGKYYFLETIFQKDKNLLDLYLDAYDNGDPSDKRYLETYHFYGEDFSKCVSQFETAKIFDGLTIYEAEKEIEVLFG